MAAVSMSMGKLIAGIVIAILASSAIAVGASTMLAAGPQGPEGQEGLQGPQGEQGIQGERGFGLPQKGNISVPAVAFVADYYYNISYSTTQGALNRNTAGNLICYAPVQLPHGATITNATF